MDLSAKGAEFIRHHEGFVAQYYLDPVDVPTIGIGFTWRSDSFREWWGANRPGQAFGPGAKMTRAEADDALRYLVKREYGAAVNDFLGRPVKQHVFDGTVSPVFNLGAGSLDWKWAQALKAGDIAKAAELLRTTGTTAGGKRLTGLVTRRKEEAELLATGDYAIGGSAASDPMGDGMLIKGERGAPVADLQRALADLGHYDGEVDGIFGYGTERAVMAFQKGENLKADGYAGPNTLTALSKAGRGPATPSRPSTAKEVAAPATAFATVAFGIITAIYTFLKTQGFLP